MNFETQSSNYIVLDRNCPGSEMLELTQNIMLFGEDYDKNRIQPFISTTQNQRYLPKNCESACIILGAGDTLFQLLANGTKIITALEINPIQTVIFKLRRSALKTLSVNEFENFLLDVNSKYFLSYDVYHQAVKAGFGLSEIAESNYWDILLKTYQKEELMNGFFKSAVESTDMYRARIALPYIKKKSLYYSVRDALEKATINIEVIDAIEYFKRETKIYDYIDISNILFFVFQVMCDSDKDRFVEVIKVLKKIYDMNLKKGGCFVLDYMFATTEKKLSSKYVDISTQESRLVSNIYNFVYAILKKEMNVKTKSVEAIAQMIDLKDNVDTILYMTK